MEYTFFSPQFGNFVITVLAFVLCLSVIVFVHEFGHYFIGKLSGIHAEVFSIGFGPVIISSYDKRGTKWQLAAFPLGGYVKFLGDKNPASSPDPEIDKRDEQNLLRKSMHGAPLWARFITVAAGPLFNFIFSGLIFFLIFMDQGMTKLPLTVDKTFDTPYEQKFEKGDVVRSVNGLKINNDLKKLNDQLGGVFANKPLTYVVERNGILITLENIIQNPPRISQVLPKSSAISAGLEKGDLILSLNSREIKNFNEIKDFVEASQGEGFIVEYWREGLVYETRLTPQIVDVPIETGGFERIYRVGIVSDYFPFQPAMTKQSISWAFLSSIKSIYLIMEGSVKGLYHIVFGNISSCNLSGPISIAETSGQMVKQGSLNYLWFIAVLSTAIGMINLFPIPVLDGGHLMFFTVEALIGRKPNQKIVNTFMALGFALLVGLMLFSVLNDFLCP
ncbi:MAG: RIP metalloprotease RseP [Paracoccaceae bacterium]